MKSTPLWATLAQALITLIVWTGDCCGYTWKEKHKLDMPTIAAFSCQYRDIYNRKIQQEDFCKPQFPYHICFFFVWFWTVISTC